MGALTRKGLELVGVSNGKLFCRRVNFALVPLQCGIRFGRLEMPGVRLSTTAFKLSLGVSFFPDAAQDKGEHHE